MGGASMEGKAPFHGHMQELVDNVIKTYSTVYFLVNNAGTAGQMSSHDKINEASFRRRWEIAALGTALLISMVWPVMEKQKITRRFFETLHVAVYVASLARKHCAVSGEAFSVGGGRAARTMLATFPGFVSDTPEGFIENFDKVVGDTTKIYISTDCLDAVSYSIKNATGVDVGKININGSDSS
ncbi:uncharacterized protein Z519_05677 [Cladophialophora bantiana CBS 173.52]|uniref:Uncharacterized protein n=1 Tax=Cladophialophora bantiana (strain ATCC 10958 / CBS 173.52 / CDC B-1940 / NIH 8579) TaxID=1442370 RepID=A0A0D2G327_CLAB1|nr:uncharacterized protein Z519_05677 [Cladophialophora bantiana CBS 173.52]KIW93072.1 hypothetical protein Z519_05677 [Cladophialophora bantiana CBS 173.52]